MIVIVPSRARPATVPRVAAAWADTNAWDAGAELLFAIDRDDPLHDRYHDEVQSAARRYGESIGAQVLPRWMPMCDKLNRVARALANSGTTQVLGFAGDDHLPRTPGWASRYLGALDGLGVGWVSCEDGYRDDDLPTQWAVTTDIVRAMGRMVPAPVEHLYCDDSVRDVATCADAYAYLTDVMIEHMHPVAGKAVEDAQYARVNGAAQYRRDRHAYREWSRRPDGLALDVEVVRAVRETREAAA